jgi:uncharacterized protein HemX
MTAKKQPKSKKATKKTARPKATKTKVVYRTRTVYRDAPKEQSPLGDVAKTTSSMVGGVLIPTVIGLGVASAIGNAFKSS